MDFTHEEKYLEMSVVDFFYQNHAQNVIFWIGGIVGRPLRFYRLFEGAPNLP